MINWNNNEYILKSGWASTLINQEIHNNYINNIKLIKDCDEFHSARGDRHPVEDFIEDKTSVLLAWAKQLEPKINAFEYSINVFLPNEELPIHNDYYDFNRDKPVRGILWINPEDVEGTLLYNNEGEDSIGVLGGATGDIFLFNTTENSYHGAINSTNTNRYTVNFTFCIT